MRQPVIMRQKKTRNVRRTAKQELKKYYSVGIGADMAGIDRDSMIYYTVNNGRLQAV
jgi:hypothetical protein